MSGRPPARRGAAPGAGEEGVPPRHPRRRAAVPAAAATLALLLCSCGGGSSASSYTYKTPEQRLVAAAETAWMTPGIPFLNGIAGLDTISKVTPTGPRSWEVTVPDPTALGGAVHWALQLTHAQVLPVDSGSAYVHWLGSRAQQVDPRLILPADVGGLLSAGRVLAVGDVEASFGRTDRIGRSTFRRVAYLEPVAGGKSHWVIEPDNREPIVLREALDTVYDYWLNNNERVMMCMGEAEANAPHGPTERKCISQELVHRFGGSLNALVPGMNIPGLPSSVSKLMRQLSGGA